MLKLVPPVVATLLASGAGTAGVAATIGPHAGDCTGTRPAMLVRVVGLKARTGTLRVQSYGGDPERFLEKGSYLERVEVPTPASGSVEVCMPVARPGTYAVMVRHQATGTTSSNLEDGGGLSGNPRRSLLDIAFKRKPAPEQISVRVGHGPAIVPVVMNYVQGGSFKPIATAGR